MFNWENLLEQIKPKISKPAFETWIKPTRLLSVDKEEQILKIQVDSELNKNWLQTRYHKMLMEAIYTITENNYNLEFIVNPKNKISKSSKNFTGDISTLHEEDTFDEIFNLISLIDKKIDTENIEIKKLLHELQSKLKLIRGV